MFRPETRGGNGTWSLALWCKVSSECVTSSRSFCCSSYLHRSHTLQREVTQKWWRSRRCGQRACVGPWSSWWMWSRSTLEKWSSSTCLLVSHFGAALVAVGTRTWSARLRSNATSPCRWWGFTPCYLCTTWNWHSWSIRDVNADPVRNSWIIKAAASLSRTDLAGENTRRQQTAVASASSLKTRSIFTESHLSIL